MRYLLKGVFKMKKQPNNLMWLFPILLTALLISLMSCESPEKYAEKYALTYEEQQLQQSRETGIEIDMEAGTDIKEIGVGIAAVLDVSGSMSEWVNVNPDEKRRKLYILKGAFKTIIDEITAWQKENPNTKLMVGVYAFSDIVQTIVRMCNFNQDIAQIMKAHADSLTARGDTAIGKALAHASRELFKTGLSRKHILVITDGENTTGLGPKRIASNIFQRSKGGIQMHFIAFDIDSRCFSFIEDMGLKSTLAEATGDSLKVVMTKVLKEKILVEKEEK